ncbi:hypothetical protein GC105_03575 [Alkalibaculum sp. M08DMB]|uniref:Uncharacterized protein n=1 Tax=Alkalibaculum sporogenes TaxID=2655001 RepID=A0A6A7K5W0_9FIRM|nr:hypothetical protein [Alkalibaculum sporogenes]MPW24869.1 hypothetical protein [Alkalibaculum sporogenes]
MLKNLLKYEIKATARIFVPFYLFLIVFSIINRIFISMNTSAIDIPRSIALGIWGFTIIAIFVMTWIVVIQRFYKNLLSDEGYLSFTLPVKAHHHVISKALTSLMWILLNFIFAIIAIAIITLNSDTISMLKEGLSVFQEMISQTGTPVFVVSIQFIILAIVGILSNLFKIYTAIIIGNLSSKHKILLGLGTYIGFEIVEQTIFSFLLVGIGYFGDIFDPNFIMHPSYLVSSLLLLICISLISASIYFFLSNWLLNDKLDLE